MRFLPVLTSVLLMASAVPAMARVDVDIDIAPPAPRVVEAPPPRHGYVWAPGYWNYDHGRHVWVDGRWMREKRGYHWTPDRWDQRDGHWHHEHGHWEH